MLDFGRSGWEGVGMPVWCSGHQDEQEGVMRVLCDAAGGAVSYEADRFDYFEMNDSILQRVRTDSTTHSVS